MTSTTGKSPENIYSINLLNFSFVFSLQYRLRLFYKISLFSIIINSILKIIEEKVSERKVEDKVRRSIMYIGIRNKKNHLSCEKMVVEQGSPPEIFLNVLR